MSSKSSPWKWLWLAPLALVACTRQNAPAAKDSNPNSLLRATALNPVPADRESLDSQLKRFRGQTKFLNYHYVPQFRALAEAAPQAASLSGGQRAVQESDIYKVGKPGSKLLYLLNNYRGLQVVSFADGADKPKLLGRVEATGNDPQDMYYVPSNDRLYVLERLWFDGNDAYARQRDSRVLVYDVSNPQAPKLMHTERLSGELADSRLVGDVLYVATSEWPSYWWESGRQSKAKGHVFSYLLKQDGLEKIAHSELQQPVSARENMNIVEVQSGGAYQYYLVAILSDSPWGWWDRKSSVEVVDISDPKGQIKTVMNVTAKGSVTKRAQTFIKNDTLIVTSNYNGEKLRRVAVETFKFPGTDPQVITTDEATFRKLYIQREVAKVTGEDAKDAKYEALVADAQLGLRGRFIRQTEKGELTKLVADSTVTIGDTHGLNANLQDVRVSGNLLYAFWVPANNRDPLDVFDLSNPENGVRHLGHTEFEGWVERAEPVLFQGKQYVVGLGWIVPSADEHSRRVPQAVLFEITQRQPSRAVRAEVVAQTNLGTGDVWADFSRGDKFTEFNLGADGKGVILFSIDSWGMKPVVGGKLVGVDLNAAALGRDDVFTDGTVLAGNPGWLRRVFTNPEIGGKNAFSDLALSTYDVKDVGSARELAKAVSVLELARNLRAYLTLGNGQSLRGLQILSNSRWETGADADATELRAVDAAKADTEKNAVAATAVLPGDYLTHAVSSEGSVLVLTNEYKTKPAEGDRPATYYTEYHLSKVTLSGNTFTTLSSTWQYTYRRSGSDRFFFRPWRYQAPQVTEVESGKYLVSTGEDVHLVTSTATGLAVSDVDTSACAPVNVAVSATLVGSRLYATYTQLVDDPSREKVQYERNFVATAALDARGKLACGPALNIPGRLLADGSALVTEDNRLEDLLTTKSEDGKVTYYQPIQKTALISLKADGRTATLVDLYDPNGTEPSALKPVGDGSFAFIENGDRDYGTPEFVLLALDEQARFTKETYGLKLVLGSRVALASVFADTRPGAYLAVVTGGRRAQVLGWTANEHRPSVKQLVALNERFEKQPAADTIGLFQTYRFSWYGNSSQALHWTKSLRSLEFVQDLYGVQQALVQE